MAVSECDVIEKNEVEFPNQIGVCARAHRPIKAWKGFTTSSDSYMGYQWRPRIFAGAIKNNNLNGTKYKISDFKTWVKRSQKDNSRWSYGIGISLYLTRL